MVDDYPKPTVDAGHVEPAPRRVRGMVGEHVVFDTTRAHYVWEWPFYPHYYIPLDDVDANMLVDEGRDQTLRFGTARRHGLTVGGVERPGTVRVYGLDAAPGIAGAVRFDWAAIDVWFEEDEQIFVHPRNPYVRVDAVRSTRSVRVELDGVLLADSTSPVMVFETGLPTRYYVNRTDVRFEHLVPSATQTPCPYKGVTSGYWTVRIGDVEHPDLAWAYDFPTRELLPIVGLICFYNEKVDITLDGEPLERPVTHFVKV